MPSFVHSLAIVTPTAAADGEVDDYGHPVPGQPVVTLVRGLVQPRRTSEVEAASQGGAAISTHVVFMARRTLSSSAFIRFEPDNGDRYEITGIRDFAFGSRIDHLEVDCRRVVSEELAGS